LKNVILTKKEFVRASFPKKNQGIVALLSDYDYFSLSGLLQLTSHHKYPLFVMLDCIEDPHNFGAILRISAAFLIDGIIISKKNQVPVNSTVIKVSMGGAAYVPVCQVSSLSEAVNELKKRKYKIVATTCEPLEITNNSDAIAFNKLSSLWDKQPLCLIFGNEHSGVKKTLIKKSDYSFYIPISNNVSSLNVATSCGIILSLLVLSTNN